MLRKNLFLTLLIGIFCLVRPAALLAEQKKCKKLPELSSEFSILSTNIQGTIWVEEDGNSLFDGESGPSGVVVELMDLAQDTVVAQVSSIDGSFSFSGIAPGKYVLRIRGDALNLGGPLTGVVGCPGFNDAADMVDDDDNGSDFTYNIFTTEFTLTNDDPLNPENIKYIDFCFFRNCDLENNQVQENCQAIVESNFICDIGGLDNFCAKMPEQVSGGIQPVPLCSLESEAENISWFAFIGADGNYSIRITPSNCTIGLGANQGFQVGVYSDCSFETPVFCSPDCMTTPVAMSSSLFTPGQVYYLFIDGCKGSVCNYEFNIVGNPTPPSLEPSNVCILSNGQLACEDISYCLNSDVVFLATGNNFVGNFSWSVTTISGAAYQGDSVMMTTSNTLILNFPSEGQYNVCLTEVSNGCSDQTWVGEVCRKVLASSLVPVPADEDFGEVFTCIEDLNNFNIGLFSDEDPNGDGTFGWLGPIVNFEQGLNTAMIPVEGCSYEQRFTLSVYQPSAVEDVLITICEEDLPIQVDNLNVTLSAFGGEKIFSVDNLLLTQASDVNGCDSIINLSVEKLSIIAGGMLEPICLEEGVQLQLSYVSDLSTEIEFLDFIWKDPQGLILPLNGPIPSIIIAPFSSGNGQYTLSVQINKNGVQCEYDFEVNVDIAQYVPSSPMIAGPILICEGDDIATYVASNGEEDSNYIWAFPNDVASGQISGAMNEILTIDWSGSAGGSILSIAQNICGQSDQTTLNVEVIPLTTPQINLDDNTCIDSIVSVSFFGTGINVSDYAWNFGGGVIVNGTGGIGQGPHEVFWDSPGQKQISLTTTSNQGCVSSIGTKTISVEAPLTPTAVTCVPSIGEIVFTWEIPPFVLGFEVNVLTGQTGVFTANSFTVSNLSESEVVTIELLTKPEDMICGEFVTTTITCEALDCSTPIIHLDAVESVCVNGESIQITAEVTTGETGSGVFTGQGIVDAANGIFDPAEANLGVNTILYNFVSDAAGCSASSTITIEVFELPEADFTIVQETICILDSLEILFNGTLDADQYLWDFDGGNASSELNPSILYNSPGVKNISLTVVNNGCSSTKVNLQAIVEPELDPIQLTCDTAGVDFISISWNDIDGVTLYQVIVDGGPAFFTPQNELLLDELEENQSVEIVVNAISNGLCPGSTFTITCTSSMSVNTDNIGLEELSIYPNPAKNVININGNINEKWTFEMLDISGKKVLSERMLTSEVDISNLKSGIFFLRIIGTEGRSVGSFKIVKQE